MPNNKFGEFRLCRKEEWGRAVEHYSSAILQWDENPSLFTNMAQAHIKMEKYDSAVEDCKRAIKLKPDSVKAQGWNSQMICYVSNYVKSKWAFTESN
jgi:Tfp pilus assembly protein PilF